MRFRVVLLLLFFLNVEYALAAGCGSRGGPGFRGPSGKCVGWKALDKVCGSPPTLLCTFEGAGIGDTGTEQGSRWIAANTVPSLPKLDTPATAKASAAPSAASAVKPNRPFNARIVKADGLACVSPQVLAALKTCPRDKDAASCDAQATEAVAKGDCAKVAKGADATIQAGSHSFDWVRVRVVGDRRELWTSRTLVLD